jgi:signal transduction histidine kinase
MRDIVAAQTPFLYLAQFALGLGIGIMLTYFSRIYSRIYLRTWSYSAYTFCVHAIAFAYLTSPLGSDPVLWTVAGLLSALFNNIHIAQMFVGVYEAVHQKPVKKNIYRLALAAAVGIGAVTAAAFSIDPKDFIYQVGGLDLITGVSFVVGGLWLLFARNLKGIGVKLVAACFILYAVTHLYDLSAVVLFVMGDTILLPQMLGIVKIVIIAMIGLGLVIWLLEDEQVQLKKINRELDSFIYSTSHDLRAPVASVIGLIAVARMEIQDEKSLEFLRLIEDRTRKLDGVIGNILSISRVKKSELKYETIDFNSLFADSMSDVKFMADGKNIDIRYMESASNKFIGDYGLTKMVLGNLLSNAVKYHVPNKPDPYIQVDFEKMMGKVCFVVADNGEGIDQEHHDRIFDMFYRASQNSQGTGLGLYIVKETLARIGGSVELQSKKGTGTTFKVTLEQPA